MKSTINKIKQGQIEGDFSNGGESGVDSIDTSIVNGVLTVTLNLTSGGTLSDSTPISVGGEYVSSVSFVDGVLITTYSENTEDVSVNLDNRYLTSLPLHEHEEYEASSRVIIIDRDLLTTYDKQAIVDYLNSITVTKEKGQTVYVHVKYIEKIIEITKLDSLFSILTVDFQLNVDDIISIEETVITDNDVSINFNVG